MLVCLFFAFYCLDSKNWATSPALYLFMDESWDKYHNTPACVDKVEHAFAAIPIGKQTRSHHDILKDHFGQATSSETKKLAKGRVEWSFKWRINHATRTHGWFVVVADCALEQYNTRVSPMDYTLKLINPGNTHLPADEYGLPKMYLLVTIFMTIYAVSLGYKMYKQHKTQKTIHLIVFLICFCFALQYTSVVYELIHLYVYKYNGKGVYYCDFFSEIFEGLSQTLIALILICLASGWTLVDFENDKSKANSIGFLLRNPSRLLEGFNIVILFIGCFVIINFVLQILNKGYDDDFQKFHDFESPPGKILVLMRFVLGLLFVYSFHVTIKFQENRGGEKLLAFLKRLRLLGGLWFLCFPLLVFVASFFAHYHRHRVVSTGMLTLQNSILCVLGYQFISDSSTYFKLSTLADSGVLPGAGGFVRAPKASKD